MKLKLLLASAAAGLLMAGASANAATVFAQVTNGNTGFYTTTPSPGGYLIGNGHSVFSYLLPGLPTGLSSMLTFSSSTTDSTVTSVSGGVTTYTLSGFGGSFTDIYEGLTKVVDGVLLTRGVTVLLSGDITDGVITVSKTGTAFNPGTFAGTVSNYVAAYPTGFANGSFGLTLGLTGQGWHTDKFGNLETFHTLASGFFAGVPEPATWGMMLLGFVGVGAALRGGRRRSTPMAVA
jgi:hypothetical protein